MKPSPKKVGLAQARRELRKYALPSRARATFSYLKAEKDGYGAGDQFLGVRVPDTRKVAKQFTSLSSEAVKQLLSSKIHEERLLALEILLDQFRRADAKERQRIHLFFLKHKMHVNNWDLVDGSAPVLIGEHLVKGSKDLFWRLARSRRLWDRRLAVVGSYGLIRAGDFTVTLKLCAQLLEDQEDLMHKACGWMLREIGKRDRAQLHRFLTRHHACMPRTMLRYAIEHYSQEARQRILAGRI